MSSGAGAGLRACMIDGIGPFETADYRRSWLFFDDVDYVFPAQLAGPIAMPDLDAQEDCAVRRPELTPEELRELLERTRRDCADGLTRRFVAERVPERDRRYAAVLAWSDVQLRAELTSEDVAEPAFAVLFLANKLLWYAATRGAIPIVGRDYSAELLAAKLRQLHDVRLGGGLLSPRGGSAFAAFAAGLALDFLPDEALAAAPIRKLAEFKARNRDLLAQHQLHLVEVARAFTALPDGADLADRVAQLRVEARRTRLELDARARDAWTGMGFELARRAVTAASAGLFSGLAVLRGHTLQDVLAAALPAAVAAGGVVVASMVDAAAKARSQTVPAMAYLFKARELVAS